MEKSVRILFFIAAVIAFYGMEARPIPLNNKLPDEQEHISSPQDTLTDLIALLRLSAKTSDMPLFKLHYNSILTVIELKESLSEYELSLVKQMYLTFTGTDVQWNASDTSSYLQRKRPIIIAWASPTDGLVSLAWLVLPDNWDPEKEYPLYVTLHGLYSPYQNMIDYMTRYLKPEPVLQKSFSDGYTVFPWGRGNLWYRGIAEIDIWECVDAIENIVKVDTLRKYLMGHSMGGFGAWAIAQNSSSVWAALGVYAGALWYDSDFINSQAVQTLKDLPVYIVCGEQDGLYNINRYAYDLLDSLGNPDIEFVGYTGGHDALFEQWERMYLWIRNYSKEVQTDVNTVDEIIPMELKLNNNYPNPFNPVTNIEFTIPHTSGSTATLLKIYDLLGREVETLVDEYKPAGVYKVEFNAAGLASGMYICTLKYNNKTISRKIQLVK